MRGYSGTCDFVHEIERYKHPVSGEFISKEEVQKLGLSGIDPEVIELHVEGSAYYREGNTWALPEDCYPDESDAEIVSATDGKDTDWLPLLTSEESKAIHDKIEEEVRKDCWG
jgi:hypothetical protein